MPEPRLRPLGEDDREDIDAIRRLRERNEKQKNMLDQIDKRFREQQEGLSKRNRAIFER